MKKFSLCVLNQDAGWAKAFLRAVSLGYSGISLTLRAGCGDCDRACDVCLALNEGGVPACPCCLVPVCGKYAGVAALLAEAKAFATTQRNEYTVASGDFSLFLGKGEACAAHVVCVHSRLGGTGTSCVSIGIGRELARYRDVRACYLCLTDMESQALISGSCAAAMPSEALLYRCLRCRSRDGAADTAAQEDLIRAAALPDEYGLLRFGVDTGVNAFSALTAPEVLGLLTLMDRALGPAFFVLDFGTRRRLLDEFCEIFEPQIFEVFRERDAARLPGSEDLWVFPECPEDIRHEPDRTDIVLANAFGLKIKELCDTVVPALLASSARG